MMKTLMRFFRWWWAEYVHQVGNLFPHFTGVETLPNRGLLLFKEGVPIDCPRCHKTLAIPKADVFSKDVRRMGAFYWLAGTPTEMKEYPMFECMCGEKTLAHTMFSYNQESEHG